jgi:hypothetical protein
MCSATPSLEFSPLRFLTDFTTSQPQYIVFRPEDGLKNRENFEQKYGWRGEKLIAALGSGSPGILDYQQQPLVHNLHLCVLLINFINYKFCGIQGAPYVPNSVAWQRYNVMKAVQ